MIDAQQIAVFVLVAAAALWLGFRTWKHTKGGACDGCGECGREPDPKLRPAPKATPLVTLSQTPPRRFTPPNRKTRQI